MSCRAEAWNGQRGDGTGAGGGSFAAALADIIGTWDWLELVLQVADSHTVSEKFVRPISISA